MTTESESSPAPRRRSPSPGRKAPNLAPTFLVSLVTAIAVVAAAAGINHAWPIFGTGGEGDGTGPVAQNTPGANPTAGVASIDVGDNPSKGPEDAAVTIVEFSDFQCPYCARFTEETLPQILSNYSDKVRFVFMNFPLAQSHPAAMKAAEGGECAHDQGAFWEYHDLLFEKQTELNGLFTGVTTQEALDAAVQSAIEMIRGYAASLGLDMQQFNECLDSGEKTDEVTQDMTAAQEAVKEAGLDRFGTPAFFINGTHVGGAQEFEVFQQVIDAALAEAE